MVMPHDITIVEAAEASHENIELWSKEYELRAQFWKGIVISIL